MIETNFYKPILGAVTAISLLAACSGQIDSSSALSSEQPEIASTKTSQDSGDSTEAFKTVESVYTTLNLDDCEVLETYEESGGRDLRCEGYQEIPLYVSEGDARFDVDAGVPNEEWITSGRPFNSISDTVEWRIHDGDPVAAILRYNFETGDSPNMQSSELAVFSIGQEGSPGCLVAWVTADAQPSQNIAARQLADRQAKGFDCSSNLSTEDIQLPEVVIGTFDQTQADCSEPMSFSRLRITQDKLDFYYGYAIIDSVASQDGGYDLGATLFHLEGQQEVRPEAVEYRIEPNAQGNGIEFLRGSVLEDTSPISLVRCDRS